MRLGTGREPPTGWNYVQEPSGDRLEAVNKIELIKRIFEYRLRNNIPIGDLEKDIDIYYCTRWPQACHKEPHEYNAEASPPPPREALVHRVARWASILLNRMPRGGYELVKPEEAQSRAKVCMNCPKNLPWRVGCVSCSSSTAALLAQLRRLNKTQQDGLLYACQVGGWENSTSVWVNRDQLELTPDQFSSLPPRCWRRDAV